MPMVERVINGNYHQALGMTPFKAFYGNMHVHWDLVARREREIRQQNKRRRVEDKEESYETGEKVLVFEFEKKNRGRLGKLVP